MKKKSKAIIEKKPLSTEADYAELKRYINIIEKKAMDDSSYRNNLLKSTGMYDSAGNPKKGFINV